MKSKKSLVYAVIAFVTVCLMQLVFTGIIYSPLSLYTSSILEELNLTRTSYALTLTCMSGICAVANWTIGWLKKRINLRGILVLGGSVMTVAMFLYSRANSLPMLYVSALLAGISFAYLASAIGASIINTWFHKHSGLLVGVSLTLSGLGGTVFSPIVGSWIANYGWRTSFVIAAGIAAVTTVLFGLFFRSEPKAVGCQPAFYEEKAVTDENTPAAELTGLSFNEAVKTPAFWATAFVWLFGAIIVYSIMGIIAVYVQDLGFDSTAAGAALAPMSLVNMIIPFLLGWLADRMPVKYIVAGGLLCFGVSCVILLSEPTSLTLVYAIAALTGVGVATLRSTIPMQVRRAFGVKEYATFAGIFVGIFSGGIAIGNPIIAAFYDATGTYASAMKFYLVVLALVIVVMLLFSDKLSFGKKSK